MNIETAKEIIRLSHITQESVLIEGVHGIGKSDIVRQFAQDNNMHIEILFLSMMETGDLLGIPHIVEKNGKQLTMWSVPVWLQRMYDAAEQGKECVLFLDELNRAHIDVRQSALQLVLDGQIQEHKLPELNNRRTMVVSAINPTDDYQVDELDPALLDRFLTLKLEVDSELWLKWARQNKINKTIISYITSNPKRLHFQEGEGKGTTPRAWAKLSEFLDLYEKENIQDDVLYHTMIGKLGNDTGVLFFGYFKDFYKLISKEDIINFIDEKAKGNINTQKIGEKLKDYLENVEVIRKKELAKQFFDELSKEDDKNMYIYLLTFLYSLELETLHSTLIEFREDNLDKYLKLTELDVDLNNKELFIKIFRKIQKD